MTINLNELPRGGTLCLSSAALGIAGTASKLKITAPNGAGVDYAIKGIFYHKADADNLAMTAATAQAVLTTCVYLVCLDSSGNLTTVKGTEQLNADLTAGTAVLDWPTPTADTCCIGAVKVKCESTATFTAGTTSLAASNVTDTYYNLAAVPVAPLTS